MSRRVSLTVLSFVALWASAAWAHHSFTNIYYSAKRIELKAVVSEFLFVHPHPFLVLSVEDASWRAEMDNRFELAEIGVTAETFKPGDRVVVSGSPGRSEPRTMYLWRLERAADGLVYEQVGSTPHLRSR